jgi:hypothetical protein
MGWIFFIPVFFVVAMGVGLWMAWRGRQFTAEQQRAIRRTLLWMVPVVLGSQILLALFLMRHFGGTE